MLAGNVTAQLVDLDPRSIDVLVVEGDSQANQIRIVEDTAGHARIEGLAGTTVNGMAADEFFSSIDTFRGVQVRLGNGDDNLTYEFAGDRIFHNTEIDMGTGDDAVTVLARTMTFLQIDTGQGNDNVTLDIDLTPGSFFLFANYRVNTGVGDDTVLVRANAFDLGPFHNFDALIDTAQGNDVVQFQGVLSGSWVVDLGEGDDTLIGDAENSLSYPLVNIHVVGGHGHDTVLNSSYFIHALYQSFYGFESIDDA